MNENDDAARMELSAADYGYVRPKSVIRTLRAALAQSGHRFSEEIMLRPRRINDPW